MNQLTNVTSTRVSGPSILAVDDKPTNLNLLCSILKDRGYRVRPVPNGELALSAVAAEPPDLILLDISMPKMDGFEVCARLKAEPRTKEIPVIFLTARMDVSEKVKAFSLGCVDYVTKPFQTEEIQARVATHLELCRQKQELRESYERLSKLEQMRDSLVHMIVHDLRSPLAALTMSLELTLHRAERALDAEARLEFSQSIASVRRMSTMITALLDVSKLEAGAMKLDLALCDLVKITRDVQASLETLSRECRVIVESESSVAVLADASLLTRVVQNLLSNAVRFTRPGGRIHIRIEGGEQTVRFTITDDGPGVAEHAREAIFEKFGAIELGRDRGPSTGLGLTFCRMAIEAHGGAIGVENRRDATGSVFWFTLPTLPATSVAHGTKRFS